MNSPITSTSAFEVAKEDFSESLNSALSDFQKEFERVLSNESNSVSGATTGNSSVYFNEDGTSTFVSHPISEQVSAESTPIDLGNQFISPIFVGEDGTISHDNPADNQSGTTEAFDEPHHPIYRGEDGTISHDNPADNQSVTT
jgi:hypothetical protein